MKIMQLPFLLSENGGVTSTCWCLIDLGKTIRSQMSSLTPRIPGCQALISSIHILIWQILSINPHSPPRKTCLTCPYFCAWFLLREFVKQKYPPPEIPCWLPRTMTSHDTLHAAPMTFFSRSSRSALRRFIDFMEISEIRWKYVGIP